MNKKTPRGSDKIAARIKERQVAKENGHETCCRRGRVWYREGHYQELLALLSDAALLKMTYAAWFSRAEAKKAEVECATHASRSGTPLEIMSKIILRHADRPPPRDTWESKRFRSSQMD